MSTDEIGPPPARGERGFKVKDVPELIQTFIGRGIDPLRVYAFVISFQLTRLVSVPIPADKIVREQMRFRGKSDAEILRIAEGYTRTLLVKFPVYYYALISEIGGRTERSSGL